MPIISQLTTSQLARHAFNVFLFAGRHVTGARLIYHSLALDHYQPEAIRCLSDLLDKDGTEIFSAVALEYALACDSGIPTEARRTLDDLRFLAKWSWGFSKHKSGKPHLGGEQFEDRTQFDVDEARYQEMVQQAVRAAGSLSGAFTAAHTLSGAMGGLLTHIRFGAQASLDELFHPAQFERTSEYDVWLASSTDELDALERARPHIHYPLQLIVEP
jgi:hypothetical protein